MTFRNQNIDADGLLFGKWKLTADTWVITNRWQNFMYLLIGQERALLIDTGYGEGNLREMVQSITDKPVIVLNTHGHFDHTGGNAWWDSAWMTAEAEKIARHTFCSQHDVWFAEKPHQDYKVHQVADCDRINLGGRCVEIIAIPAHEESSIAILDSHARLLFTGDELEAGQVLLFTRGRGLSLEEVAQRHKNNMLRLKARRGEYDFLCPAHNGVMLEPDTYLDDFIALDTAIIDHTALPQPDTAGFGFPASAKETKGTFAQFEPLARMQYGQASIIYQVEA